MARLLLILQ